jgi:hypothetical protein
MYRRCVVCLAGISIIASQDRDAAGSGRSFQDPYKHVRKSVALNTRRPRRDRPHLETNRVPVAFATRVETRLSTPRMAERPTTAMSLRSDRGALLKQKKPEEFSSRATWLRVQPGAHLALTNV